MNNQKIGEHIYMLRKEKNLTQKELADMLSVTDKAVSKWERGVGYPDIALLKPLADALGITVNELLEGETTNTNIDKECIILQNSLPNQSAEEKSYDNKNEMMVYQNSSIECIINKKNEKTTTNDTENAVNNIIDYADKVIKVKELNKSKILAAIISVLLLVAMLVCLIVNLAVEKQLTWSYLVFGSCILGGFVVIPPLLNKKRGIIISLGFITILIMPFLALIQSTTLSLWAASKESQTVNGSKPVQSEWLWSLAFPIVLTWLVIVWLITIIYKRIRINKWFFASITLMISIPGEVITNVVVKNYVVDQLSNNFSMIANAVGCAILAGLCLVVGLIQQYSKKPFDFTMKKKEMEKV